MPKIPALTCKACQGSGKNSKGKECYPCKGKGKLPYKKPTNSKK